MSPVTVRPYRPTDHSAGRRLWGELTVQHRALYDDPGYGGQDPSAAFEEYLTRLDLAGMWVADHPDDGVVGLIGMVMTGQGGTVEPVVVAEGYRGQGIGKALLDQLAEAARRRGLLSLTISPESRNIAAIKCLHAAGYTVLSSVELTLDLAPQRHEWRDGLHLYEREFRS